LNLFILLSACQVSPVSNANALFYETFEKDGVIDPWELGVDNNVLFSWGITTSDYNFNDHMLQFFNEGLHIAGIASVNAKINHTISLKNESLILQYKAIIPNKGECSYGCVSLFSGNDKNNLQEVVRFGPSKCSNTGNTIYNMLFSINGIPIVDEQATDFNLNNLKEHVYTLVIEPNGEYEIFIDCKSFKTGKFTDSQQLSVNNAAAIKRVGFRNYNSDQNGDSPYYFNNIFISQDDSDPKDLCSKELAQSLIEDVTVEKGKDETGKDETSKGDLGEDSVKDGSEKDKTTKGSSAGLIAGIIISCVVVLAGVGLFIFIKLRKSYQNDGNSVFTF